MSRERWSAWGRRESSSITPDVKVSVVAQALDGRGTKTLVVCEEGHPVGTISARDLVTRVLAKGRSPEEAIARDIMSRDVIVAPDDLSPLDYAVIMGERGVECLPLVGPDGKLTSVLLLEDLLRIFVHGLSSLGTALLKADPSVP